MGFVVSEGDLRQVSVWARPISAYHPRGIASFRGTSSSYEAIYRSQPHIRSVVEFLGRNIGQLTPRVLERVSDIETRATHDHPLAQLLRKPHPRWSKHRFYNTLVQDLAVFDNFIAAKVKVDGSGIKALSRIPPQWVDPIGGDWLTPDGFRLVFTGEILPRDSVVHICGYNPVDARWGLSPIETLRQILDEDMAASEAREQFWQRATRMGNGWISRPADAPDWNAPGRNNAPSGRDRFLASFRDRQTSDGPDAGHSPVFEEGMEWHESQFDSQALQYLEARQLKRSECCTAYHVSPGLLGYESNASVDRQETNRKSLYADTFAPVCDQIAAELMVQLLPDYELAKDLDRFLIEFDLYDKLTGDFATEAEALSRAIGAPYMTRSEGRARRGLPFLEGSDELIVPLNVTSGGRASPADTAPGTPGLGQASRKALGPGPDKALADLPAVGQSYAARHTDLVKSHLERQQRWYTSRLGIGNDVTGAFNKTRADRELTDDLAGLAMDYAPEAAAPVAEKFSIDYNVDGAHAWLLNNARIAAERFNAGTLAALVAMESNYDVDNHEGASDVFASAAGARADGFGIDRVVAIASFAMHDAAQQAGAGTKTWIVNGANPRESHAALDGVTLPIGEMFDVGGNDAKWPGDPDLPVEEVAGCTCSLEFG
jgi:HK97 family phage portal protein